MGFNWETSKIFSYSFILAIFSVKKWNKIIIFIDEFQINSMDNSKNIFYTNFTILSSFELNLLHINNKDNIKCELHIWASTVHVVYS